MKKMAKDLTELIGGTPLVELSNFSRKGSLEATIAAKLESFNPTSSVKDRAALGMILDAEQRGILKPDSVIVEPSSGNTGIALAAIAAAKNYRLMITLPETFSVERRAIMQALGAELILTPGAEGMPGAIRRAAEIAASMPGAVTLDQFSNPANPKMHAETTAEEIWRDTAGEIDIFVAGVGTGGTISGVGSALKKKRSDIRVIAVEPAGSPVLSGGEKGVHRIQGIGAGFIPENFNREVVDEILRIDNEEAFDAARRLARSEGILAGISSGAALRAAEQAAARPENRGRLIVVLLPDTGERYLSTPLFSEG